MTDSDQLDQNIEQTSKTLGKKAGKTIGKKIATKLLPILAKFFAATAPIWVALMIIVLVIVFIYSAFPGGQTKAGEAKQVFFSLTDAEKNDEVKEYYKEIAEKNNFRDMWLDTSYDQTNTDKLFGLSDLETIYSKEDIISVLDNSSYSGTHGKDTTRVLRDYYNRDDRFKIDFGTIHAASLVYILSFGKMETTDEFKEQAGVAFRPYLYYKESTVTTCSYSAKDDEWSCNTQNIYLLTEANALRGHYTYEYEWQTETNEAGTYTKTYEVPISETLINSEWERLDQWIYDLMDNPDEAIIITRKMLIEAGAGFTQEYQNLKWLFEGYYSEQNISSGIISPMLAQYFQKAEEAFGYPAWFLQAIAFQESSLNPDALNSKTNAYGLMQLTPVTQKSTVDTLVAEYAHLLSDDLLELYNSTTDKNDEFYKQIVSDPQLNILAGCIDLKNKGLSPSIDWDGNWKNQTLKALAGYGGHQYVPQKLWSKYNVSSMEEAKSEAKVLAWARDNYVQAIWDHADKFMIGTSMPFEGTYPITASFGQRGDWAAGWHTGVDFGMNTGTPLLSALNGEVKSVGWQNSYGQTIVITNYQYEIWYAHLSKYNVKAGQTVKAGQQIGLSGNSGKSSGPHLHLEVRPYNGEYGNVIDPILFLNVQL